MCIIAAVPAGLKLDKATFDRCWDKNPDGFGMSYIFNGEIRTKKTMSKEKAWNTYNGVTNIVNDSWMILHFRIGTHGTKDINNCHPFQVHKDLVFCHNGVIRQIPDCPDKLLNDTQMFNNMILKYLPKDFYKYSPYKMLIEEYVGYSKLVFLDINNDVYIYNESKGEWHDGVWFSNTGYKEIPKYVPVKHSTSNVASSHHSSNNDWSRAVSDWYGQFYPYEVNKERNYLVCEYCSCTKEKSAGKEFDNVGFLCRECIDELKSMKIDPTDMTLDEIISKMFGVEEDDVQVVQGDDTKSVQYGGKWLSWDEYMTTMGYYESHYRRD